MSDLRTILYELANIVINDDLPESYDFTLEGIVASHRLRDLAYEALKILGEDDKQTEALKRFADRSNWIECKYNGGKVSYEWWDDNPFELAQEALGVDKNVAVQD